MKSFTLTGLLALASIVAVPVAGYSIQPAKRQVECSNIGYYFKLVNTALFSVNYVQNYAHPCDVDLIPYFESQGLNGAYALDLICLYNAGTRLFNESLSVVNDNLIVTLVGLFDAAAFNNDPSRNLSCANVNTKLLEAIELDSAVIKSIICDYTPCTLSTSSRSSSTLPTSRPASSSVVSSVTKTSSVSASVSLTNSVSSSLIPTLPPYTQYYK